MNRHFLSEPVRAYAHATEVALADRDHQASLRSATNAVKHRAEARSANMVADAWRFGVTPEAARDWRCLRLAQELATRDFSGFSRLEDDAEFLRREHVAMHQQAIAAETRTQDLRTKLEAVEFALGDLFSGATLESRVRQLVEYVQLLEAETVAD